MTEAGGLDLLHLDRVTRRFDDVVAVDSASFSVGRGELLTLLGPSGCGKTTVLRLIAGFERPDDGRILLEGRDITTRKAQQRGFGMVFQSYALFPHLNVFENVAFGLRARRRDGEHIREMVSSALDLVELSAFSDRRVQALSGGQQQRVALARALAIEPPLLLLDEPLSNLDQALRVRTRRELRSLVKRLGITAIFVTHDQEEAFDLSDRIAVMRDGAIVQVGTPRALYDRPIDRFVAGFVGQATTLAATIDSEGVRVAEGVVWPLAHDSSIPEATGTGGFSGREEGLTAPLTPGTSGILVVRPEELDFAHPPTDETLPTPLPGVVRDRRFRGGASIYLVELTSKSPREARTIEVVAGPGGPEPGSPVAVRPRPGARLHFFADGGG